MARAMEINLGIRGVTRTVRGIRETGAAADTSAGQVDRFSESIERLSRNLEQLSRQRVSFSARGGGLAPPGDGSPGGARFLPARIPAEPRERPAAGPLERLQRARDAFDADPDDFDRRYRLQRAEQSYERAQRALAPKTFLDKLGDAVGTSRFSLGGPGGAQVMPLVNRVLPLFGEGLTKLNVPLAIAAAGLGTLASVSRTAAEDLRTWRSARTLSGGTGRDIAGLTGLGVDPGQIADRAAQFRQRISLEGGDVFAQMAARQLGLPTVMGRNYGPQNEANLYLQGLERLRTLRRDPTQQLRVARQLGLEEDLDRVNVSDSLWHEMRRGITARGRDIDAGAQPSRDLDASRTVLRNAWQDATSGLGRQWARVETWWNQGLARDLNTINQGGFRVPFTNLHLGNRPQPDTPPADTQKEATKDLTSKIEKLTEVLEHGLANGGERARSALRLSGPGLVEAIRANAFLNGAWPP